MGKILLLFIGFIFFGASKQYGQNYWVYHERSTAATGCLSLRFLNQVLPTPSDTVQIAIQLHPQLNAGQAAVYYTTDGSNPSGSLGRGTGTTLVATAIPVCSGNGATLVARAQLPPQPAGTIVKYIFSAWNSTNYEVFGNSEFCAPCTPVTTSTNARQMIYAVQGVLPITFVNYTARENNKVVRLYWASAQESNMAFYEIYRSKNSLQFEKIGTVTALGNTSQRTDYFFDDQQPFFGNNYYRVTAVDRNGKTASTSIMRVLFGKNDNSIVVFGNPSNSLLNVRVVDIVRGEYAIRIFEASGKLVYESKVSHNGADGIYPVQLPQPLSVGNYRLVLTNRYQFYQSSFLLQ